jgi:hypothetical protein
MFRRKVRREGKEKPAAEAVEKSRAEPHDGKPKEVTALSIKKRCQCSRVRCAITTFLTSFFELEMMFLRHGSEGPGYDIEVLQDRALTATGGSKE